MSSPVALPVQRTEPMPVELAAPAQTARTDKTDTADKAPKAADASRAPEAKPQPEREPPTRLMVEEVDGTYVYTVLDRVSGHVIARIPRENADQLENVGYEAGAMVNTQA